MEAKDTVMTEKEVLRIYNEGFDKGNLKVAQAQAEISFKAGQEDVMLESKLGTITVSSLVGRGRKEVVEYLEKHFMNVNELEIDGK